MLYSSTFTVFGEWYKSELYLTVLETVLSPSLLFLNEFPHRHVLKKIKKQRDGTHGIMQARNTASKCCVDV